MLELLEIAVAIVALNVDCAGPDRPSWPERRGFMTRRRCVALSRGSRDFHRGFPFPLAAPGIRPKRTACQDVA
jgi:hypothetical protein